MKSIGNLIVILLLTISGFAQQSNWMALETGFNNPPNEAKARTWWHWVSGNVSKQGITKDLEAMKQVGIQEAQLFNVQLEFPSGPVKYLSAEWLDLFHFSAKEANRLGLELTFHNSAGWSSSGGPWMTPEYAMQKVVYSEVVVQGNQIFKKQLQQPETKLNYYQDIAVFAFPKPKRDVKIDGLDYKNLSGRIRNHLLPDLKGIPSEAIIDPSTIIDVTSKMSKNGILEWHVPKGEWVILRLGHTPTGKNNHPAPESGTGLEVDKMSKQAVDVYWKGGIQPIIDKLGPLIGTTVNNCLIDSYEVGTANWTSGFNHEFERLRGYNLNLYLPAIAGYYVGSGEITERFLWDYRRTIGDLMAENYYAHFGSLCRKNKLKFSVEPYWGPFDNMQVGETGDIIMCEFWSGGYPFFDSPKFVSSIAHLNGSSIVGAESFTGIGGWDEHPALLKSIGDRAWAEGINRFIFHTYVHQPWDVAPGLALSLYGTDFNRLNTWWTQSKAYMDYIARSQFLLQEGKSVADVLVFTGESSPNDAFLFPEIKSSGYDYDLIGSNKLTELYVKNGKLYTKHSGPYEVLVLTESDWMKPETLRKMEALTKAGAKVIGKQPKKSPSLQNYPLCDQDIQNTARKLWDSKLVEDLSITNYLKNANIPVDFKVEQGDVTDINFIHRKVADSDIYFVANARKENRQVTMRFRATGKQPELWNAETGKIEDLLVWKSNADGTVSVPISFESEQAVFVVFSKPADANKQLVETTWNLEKPTAEPLSNLKISKAEYGSFLQEGLIDITELVKNQVKENEVNFSASREFCDCDPAMGYVKEFRMQYQIGDTLKIIEASEKEKVYVNSGDKKLKIIRALFGKFKSETKGVPKYYPVYDVTDKVNKQIQSGNLIIPVNNALVDDQMIEGEKTSLKITFSTDGEERTLLIPEGQELNLGKNLPKPTLAYQNEKLKWITPYKGDISYTDTSGIKKKALVTSVPEPMLLTGHWEVHFPSKTTNATVLNFEKLHAWSESSNEAIKYFSGTASYKKAFTLSKKLLKPDTLLELDLGSVAVIAEVIINGKNAGILWKAPFRINMDGFVKKGKNTLEVKITNLWPNRLIGDEALPLDFERMGGKTKVVPEWLSNNATRNSGRSTFSSWNHYKKDSKLLSSGLLGPVKINVFIIKDLK